jgi:hypothetical protein
MKKALLVLCLTAVAAWGSGCATIATGKYQDIIVTSDPSGAEITSSTGRRTITPGTLTLRRSEPCVLTASLESYPELERHLTRTTQGWLWGNILLGGIVGVAVDVASGSDSKFKENEVFFDFEKAKRVYDAQWSGYRARSKQPNSIKPPQNVTARSSPPTQTQDTLVVKGIVWSPDRPAALIGDQIVREGGSVSGARVTKITRDSVEFEMNGTTWRQGVSK